VDGKVLASELEALTKLGDALALSPEDRDAAATAGIASMAAGNNDILTLAAELRGAAV
jgi:hypothetical protein